MQRSKQLALLMLGGLISITANADNSTISYSYLSAGANYDRNGWNKPLAEFFKNGIDPIGNSITHQALTPKISSLGGYLHGSYALDDNLFLEAKLRYLGGRKNGYFVGVGYHLAVADNADFYVTGGVSQPDLPAKFRLNQQGKTLVQGYPRSLVLQFMNLNSQQIYESISRNAGSQQAVLAEKFLDSLEFTECMNNNETLEEYIIRVGEDLDGVVNRSAEVIRGLLPPLQQTIDDSEISLKSQLAPTLEVGCRINFNEQLGARLAYRGSYDSVRMQGKFFDPIHGKSTSIDCKKHGLSHEGTLEATYAFTPNLMAEAGYTISQMFKIGTVKPKSSQQYTVGLRYAF
jgi:opacity protein-like surface antigen